MVIRIDGNVDGLALPLRLGVNGLKHNMKEEGLFRSSLLLDYWPKYCNAQFKGKYQKNHQLIDCLIDNYLQDWAKHSNLQQSKRIDWCRGRWERHSWPLQGSSPLHGHDQVKTHITEKDKGKGKHGCCGNCGIDNIVYCFSYLWWKELSICQVLLEGAAKIPLLHFRDFLLFVFLSFLLY